MLVACLRNDDKHPGKYKKKKRERKRREEREGMRDKSLWSMCVATSHTPDSQSFIDSIIVWTERIHVAQLTAPYARKLA